MVKAYKYPSSFEKSSASDPESKYRTVIKFYEYRRFVGGEEDTIQKSTIILPLPLGFTDTNSIDTGAPTEQTPLTTGIAVALGSVTGSSNTTGTIGKIRENFSKDLSNIMSQENFGKLTKEVLTSDSAKTAVAIAREFFPDETAPVRGIQTLTGAILNPHSVLSFDGVKLKNYNLNWKFSPYSQDDINKLKEIEREIKKRMYPEVSVGNILLEYPHMCTVKFKNIDIFPIRRSFITNFSMNFGSNDVMNLYKRNQNDAYPIVVTMNMQLSELEIRTSGANGNIDARTDDELIRNNPSAGIDQEDLQSIREDIGTAVQSIFPPADVDAE